MNLKTIWRHSISLFIYTWQVSHERRGSKKQLQNCLCKTIYTPHLLFRRCHGAAEISDFVVEVIRGYQENKICTLELYLKKFCTLIIQKYFFDNQLLEGYFQIRIAVKLFFEFLFSRTAYKKINMFWNPQARVYLQ